MLDPTSPGREVIARMVGNNPEAIRKMERLFEVAGSESPSTIADLEVLVGSALAALRSLQSMETEADAGALPFVDSPAPVVPPPVTLSLNDIEDANVYAPVDGDLLQFSSGEWIAAQGATGSFTTTDAKTVTVTSGVITAIV